jgi:hypothetical protein
MATPRRASARREIDSFEVKRPWVAGRKRRLTIAMIRH